MRSLLLKELSSAQKIRKQEQQRELDNFYSESYYKSRFVRSNLRSSNNNILVDVNSRNLAMMKRMMREVDLKLGNITQTAQSF